MKLLRRAINYIKANGIKKSIWRLFCKIRDKFNSGKKEKLEQENYLKWIDDNEPSLSELEEQKKYEFKYNPKISIIVPMYNTKERYFCELIDSVKAQTYSNFELCLADGSERIQDFIKKYISDDERIKYKLLEKNDGISGNSNEGLKMATGDFIALLDHDDILPAFSLFEVVKSINENKDVDFLYSDEDKLMEYKDKRMGPHFKPDFAIDTLRSYNYICHLSVFKKELLDKIGGFRKEYDGSQDYDIIFRATSNAKKIVHIPKILYHWRINEASVASSASAKPYAYVAAKKAIKKNLDDCHQRGEVLESKILGLYRVRYFADNNKKVSIIIPNKDHVHDLKKCIKSILKSTYNNYEIIIVENNSIKKSTFKYYEKIKNSYTNIKVIVHNQDTFNYSNLNNVGVKNSSGDILLFLNNDIEIISNDFLQTIVGDVSRGDIGIVGAKLLYRDNTIQHAGIVLNFTGIAGHVNAHLKSYDVGYMGRTMIQQNFNAVTGAMLAIKRTTFDEIDGFDENFPVAYNDIDICLKVRSKGLLVLYDPYIEAYHYESKTRGYEDTEEKKDRLNKDTNRIKEKWPEIFSRPDEYFNINFRNDVPDMRVKIKE